MNTHTTWSEYPTNECPAETSELPLHLELSENGWGAVIAWLVGPTHVYRTTDRSTKRLVQTTLHHANGDTSTTLSERTAEDQRGIDDDIDEYLAEREIPPRPRGFDWILVLPPRFQSAAAFYESVNKAASSATSPFEEIQAMTAHIEGSFR